MKLYLRGHTERYPVEQLQMQLFPDEPSEFVTAPFSGDGTVSSLSRGAAWVTASARVTRGGKSASAFRRVRAEAADVRHVRRILQQSYYLAALQLLPSAPPWGALSGVRPSKLSTECLLAGGTEKDAAALLRNVYFVSPERAALCADASRHTVQAMGLLEKNDLSVYIGIPFCPTRCAYCSFVSQSIERCGELLEPYLEALLKELAHTGRLLAASGYRVRTLYMGGGTPTTLSSGQMERLLAAIREHLDLSRCLEFTVEGGRPDTLDEQKLRVIKSGGCTRISINPQTMQDGVLRAIGRKHTAAQTLTAFGAACRAGFGEVNMDLIAGLPGDTPEGFADSLGQVLALRPSNVTVHTLALKKGAELFRSRADLPGAEAVARMLAEGQTALRRGGYEPYYLYRQKYMSGSFENVGWCRDGSASLYNICMMEELHSILSLGGGGMNKIMLPGRRLARFHNPKDPRDYLARLDTVLRQKDEIFDLLRQIPQGLTTPAPAEDLPGEY